MDWMYKHKYQKYKYKYKRLKGGKQYNKPFFFVNKSIQDKLLKYQIPHANKLIENLRDNTTVLDASDTGTGKTYVAAAVCKQLNLKPIIICPKTVMSTWRQVMEQFEVKPLIIVNYETIRLGKS
jgi:superfamily II DNA or RNA helicase